MDKLLGIPNWAAADVRRADRLAWQARAAALAGEHAKAEKLRRQFDKIYDQLEAEAAARAGVPAGACSEQTGLVTR